jgi:hypothetical protein
MNTKTTLAMMLLTASASLAAGARAADPAASPLDPSYYRGHPGAENPIAEAGAGIARAARATWAAAGKVETALERAILAERTPTNPLDPAYYWGGPVARAAVGSTPYVDDHDPLTPRYYIDHPNGFGG